MKKEKKENHFIKKPFYEGGIDAMKTFVRQQLTYPKAAIENKVEGIVFVRYTINYKGIVTATKIISGIGHGCDEEASRIVKMLAFIVPKNRNLKAVFHKNIQIHFKLPVTQKKITLETSPPSSLTIQYNYTPTKKIIQEVTQEKKKGGSYFIQWKMDGEQ